MIAQDPLARLSPVSRKLMLAGEPDPVLVVLWDVRDDPELQSVVLSGELGGGFSVELPEGAYNVAAYAIDARRDKIRGVSPVYSLDLRGDLEYELTLVVEVMKADLEIPLGAEPGSPPTPTSTQARGRSSGKVTKPTMYEDEDGDTFYVDEDGDHVYVDQDTGEELYYIDGETGEVGNFVDVYDDDEDGLDEETLIRGGGRAEFVRQLKQRGLWLGAGASHIYYQGEDYVGEKPRVVIRDTRIRLEKMSRKTYKYELWQSYRLGEETDLALDAIDEPRNHFLVRGR